ncbi:hypothetical protein HanHA300_Chr13g0491601 [Helianthus annuus]|nr:hypothetical protein HanHA300_Chr13g0491601 [Helianthus annuus]KAJ0482250.1 hypothetical protein HanIR_Chr13g0651821 [Helianthus annuus]KAJ0498535.1 hypothetical protein HanHA89_Chr13g0523731 [Helianthus annuus]KAJ0664549.1 hypothetical protein HanLR1_Chr13g0493721 [Helianthus annuus]KAJ0672000.1 hypothetical protein HanOQP8_Chr13g0492051 [Helianthus annuus]
MAYGQKGRGKKYVHHAKEEKYELYPEIKEFPDVNLKHKEDFSKLISWGDCKSFGFHLLIIWRLRVKILKLVFLQLSPGKCRIVLSNEDLVQSATVFAHYLYRYFLGAQWIIKI